MSERLLAEIVTKEFQTNAGTMVYNKFVGRKKEVVILYIHGLGPITSRTIEGFARQFDSLFLSEYSIILPHLIGYGKSAKPNNLDVYKMENQGQYIYNLLLAEKVRDVVIMGTSMGGPIAISLVENIKNKQDNKIKIKGLIYLEGNLDINDAFFSSTINKYTFEQFKEQFDSWVDNQIKKWKSNYLEEYRLMGAYSIWGSAHDLVKLSKTDQLFPRLQRLIDFPVYFIFGEKNKGRFTSEKLVTNAKLNVRYVPDAGHLMRIDNPSDYWRIIKELLQSFNM
ncbi:MAG: alpha/beta fold hydrolase [Promethearchaeota archaeon]